MEDNNLIVPIYCASGLRPRPSLVKLQLFNLLNPLTILHDNFVPGCLFPNRHLTSRDFLNADFSNHLSKYLFDTLSTTHSCEPSNNNYDVYSCEYSNYNVVNPSFSFCYDLLSDNIAHDIVNYYNPTHTGGEIQ